ncbi:30S ribosomal protein S5 [Candidatus Pacearchaeota archaeon]|nr:MAG: 30S ribosomal protein S5 [Candidatus Pacearchaeota archaeon]
MTDIVDAEEKAEEERISIEADKRFKEEEGRTEKEKDPAEIEREEKFKSWVPKTSLGKDVLAGKIKSLSEVFRDGRKIMEPEIFDFLVRAPIIECLFIGQAKGKFGGGKRRAFRQTQKKTKEGNILTFGVMAVVGDGEGHVGIGYGRASETLPAREKAIRRAKLNLIEVPRGCASYDCSCSESHSIPLTVYGKCSSVRVKLIPAPQGTGLVIGDEMKKVLRAAGIRDIYSKCYGKVRTTFNTAKAVMAALSKVGGARI